MLRISIHALLAESDIAKFAFMTNLSLFLSTLSLRRATQQKCGDRKAHVNFYPRSPCGERPSYSQHVTRPSLYFYPRSPCGERRYTNFGNSRGLVISIHALLAESDRAPSWRSRMCTRFLSTLSLRRATKNLSVSKWMDGISIHALLAESDDIISIERCSLEISIHALLAESDG